MKKLSILLFTLFLTKCLLAQASYTLKNEEAIFSLETKSGKIAVLSKDKGDNYIVYRFGTKDKIEIEYPGKTQDSWKKFKYSFYFRGGGKANEAMDLNYVAFENNGYKYVIYDTYGAVDEKSETGILVTNLKTSKTSKIIAKHKKGTLIDFRENNLLEIDDELYN